MKLVIAEKKNVAQAIAQAIAPNAQENKGYFSNNEYVITWCAGHLITVLEPHEYNGCEHLKDWKIEPLPFYMANVQYKPIEDKEFQLKVVINLIKKASLIIHCGDPDDEGQLIIDELLTYTHYKGSVQRVLINDNNLVSKEFAKAVDNKQYQYLGYQALARSICDWHFGLNLTRAFTLLNQRKGGTGTVSVGRVQDVMKGLVVRRCREIQNFVVKDYFVILSTLVTNQGVKISGKYQNTMNPNISHSLDDENRIIIENHAQQVVNNINQHSYFKVIDIQVKNESKAPPLPYNLLKLQIDMSRKYGISMDRTLEITQALRDKYNAITYNRSDCQYLNDETYSDSRAIIQAIVSNCSIFDKVAQNTDLSIKSKCFNSKKVSAHHAIIPTMESFDFSKLTDEEQKCYQLIARSFIAQFYPNHKYKIETTTLTNEYGDFFTITTKSVEQLGWLKLYKNDVDNDETKDNEQYSELEKRLQIGDVLQAIDTYYDKRKTTPPSYYTDSTFANELTRVARYISDPKLKQIMIERDKGKEGEHGGIGTPATRSTIFKELFERGFLVYDGKKILATQKAYDLYDLLPNEIRYPDLTAIWHEDVKEIRTLDDCNAFVRKVMNSINQIINNIKSQYNAVEVKIYPCPECGKELRRFFSKKNGNPFWSCIGYRDESCKYSCTDNENKPTYEKPTMPKKGKRKTFNRF